MSDLTLICRDDVYHLDAARALQAHRLWDCGIGLADQTAEEAASSATSTARSPATALCRPPRPRMRAAAH